MAIGQSIVVKKAPTASAPTVARKLNLSGGDVNVNPFTGQKFVDEKPAVAAPVRKLNLAGGDVNVNPLTQKRYDGQPTLADNPESPRSKAAKLMKRQAGIGQLTTRHVEEEPLI